MDIQKLKVQEGDIVIITYGENVDVDMANKHFNEISKPFHEKGVGTIANMENVITSIKIISSSEEEVFPFR